MSMLVHRTSFCFVCSHLASGEKEGDELRRNSDVAEILKNTQFPKTYKCSCRRFPEKILDHEYVTNLNPNHTLTQKSTYIYIYKNRY